MSRSTDISPLTLLLSRVDAVADGEPARDTVQSGFPSLDRMLGGGFRRGDLIVLAGDIASGKSALALGFAVRACVAGHQVLYLTGEMAPERVLERIIAVESRVSVDELRQGKLTDVARASVGATAVRLRDSLPVVEPLPCDPTELASLLEARRAAELVVLDSFESSLGTLPDAAIPERIRELKRLAVAANRAILTTVARPGPFTTSDRRPTLEDFTARTGLLREAADVVLAIFREDLYAPANDIAGATELLVRKNRNGGTGYVDLYFYAACLRFEDMLDPDS
jgi:replicative DNA helicase